MEGKGDDDDDVAEVLAPSAAITARVLSSFAHRDLNDLFKECQRHDDVQWKINIYSWVPLR